MVHIREMVILLIILNIAKMSIMPNRLGANQNRVITSKLLFVPASWITVRASNIVIEPEMSAVTAIIEHIDNNN